MSALLEKQFNDMKEVDPRRAAEIAYVLARINLAKGNTEKAQHFGEASIQLFDKCKMETLEDCAARYTTLEEIPLPDIIHQEVVRNRLAPLKL